MNRVVATVILSALVGAGGCKRAAENTAETFVEKAIERESGGKADVDLKGGTMTIKTGEGEVIVTAAAEGIALPADFPKDVFVPGEGRITHSLKTSEGFQLMVQTPLAAARAAEQVAAEMKARGWEQESSFNSAETVVYSFQKEEGRRQATVSVTKDGTGSLIQITTVTEGR